MVIALSPVSVLGYTGACLVVSAYACSRQCRPSVTRWMNGVGACLLGVHAAWNGMWPQLGTNVVWVGVTVVGRKRRDRPTSP